MFTIIIDGYLNFHGLLITMNISLRTKNSTLNFIIYILAKVNLLTQLHYSETNLEQLFVNYTDSKFHFVYENLNTAAA